MIRVTQSILGRGHEASERGEEPGDCMRAAVASIFELPLAEVPHFLDTGPRHAGNGELWWYAWLGWAQTRGVVVRPLGVLDGEHLVLPGYSLLAGLSPRSTPDREEPLRHCVVAWNGQMVHDPHPSGDGLVTVEDADYLVPVTEAASVLLGKAP